MFAGFVCTFQPESCTGWVSEGVNIILKFCGQTGNSLSDDSFTEHCFSAINSFPAMSTCMTSLAEFFPFTYVTSYDNPLEFQHLVHPSVKQMP